MATNSLSLNIPDVMTDCVLRIEDTSAYNSLMPYICPTLQILVPGYKNCVSFNDEVTSSPLVAQNFIFNLSACNLGVQQANCGNDYDVIPDGIYVIKYSLSPNDKSYVEYNHLRVTAIK